MGQPPNIPGKWQHHDSSHPPPHWRHHKGKAVAPALLQQLFMLWEVAAEAPRCSPRLIWEIAASAEVRTAA